MGGIEHGGVPLAGVGCRLLLSGIGIPRSTQHQMGTGFTTSKHRKAHGKITRASKQTATVVKCRIRVMLFS
jgi:hypothetical protein